MITSEVNWVNKKELDEAKAILDVQNEVVFRFEDKMCEPSAHNVLAYQVKKSYELYGLQMDD